MLEEQAALTIQRFFAPYRFKKQVAMEEAMSTGPAQKLLRAFDLRFQCMRAVAAAKFPENRPIEDPAQVARVIANIRNLAEKKGIMNLDAIERIFRQNILLAERIQKPYYHVIWKKSYPASGIDAKEWLKNAYQKLCDIVHIFNLSIDCRVDSTAIASGDVLSLARDIIQYASNSIIEALAESESLLASLTEQELTTKFEKMLAEYMRPKDVSDSKENIRVLAEEVVMCTKVSPK